MRAIGISCARAARKGPGLWQRAPAGFERPALAKCLDLRAGPAAAVGAVRIDPGIADREHPYFYNRFALR